MLLQDVFKPKTIKINLAGATKAAAFMELIEAIQDASPELDRDELFVSIIERERKKETAIGNGAALPHGYSKAIETITGAIGISQEGIPYNTPDKKPVRVIFMLVMSKRPQEDHIVTLNRILRLVTSDGYPMLRNARSGLEAWNALSRLV